jgi:hypothetical protein
MQVMLTWFYLLLRASIYMFLCVPCVIKYFNIKLKLILQKKNYVVLKTKIDQN